MNCPHCMKPLSVTEKAFGKTVPCPGCNQPISVSPPTEPLPAASDVVPPPRIETTPEYLTASNSPGPLPAGLPPMPPTDEQGKLFSWYIPGEGNQPAGPFTAEQIIQALQTERLAPTTICWREGMSQWLPLSQIEPFISSIFSAGDSRRTMAHSAASPSLPQMPPLPQSGNKASCDAAMTIKKKKDIFGKKEGSIVEGAITLAVGILFGSWAQSHTPGNRYPYFICVVLAMIFAIHGIVNIARATIKNR